MPTERKAAGLADLGVTHAITLAPLAPEPYLGNGWSGRYTHLPIPDGVRLHEATQRVLLALADTLAAAIDDGGVVLTMCAAGRNRSGLMSALVVRSYLGIPGAAALEIVRLRRPRAVANDVFADWLRSLP
jgi:protein-tyrosine phosphatase